VAGIAVSTLIPQAKIGRGNFIYVFSGGYSGNNATKYFGLSAVNGIINCCIQDSTPALTVAEAYNMDSKIDDGLPQSGRVVAIYNTRYGAAGTYLWNAWADGGGDGGVAPGTAKSPTSLTCYDNGGNASAPMKYTVAPPTTNSANLNCALSFRFQ